MKSTFIFLTLLYLITSCSQPGSDKSTSDKKYQQPGTSPKDSRRQQLIAELKNIGSIFLSNDKNKISQLFPFPLADTILNLYVDDSSYYNDYKKNDNRITKDMFVKYFPQVQKDF